MGRRNPLPRRFDEREVSGAQTDGKRVENIDMVRMACAGITSSIRLVDDDALNLVKRVLMRWRPVLAELRKTRPGMMTESAGFGFEDDVLHRRGLRGEHVAHSFEPEHYPACRAPDGLPER